MILALKIVLIILIAPIAGGLITGFDRIISARMQGRKGPPVLQPFYDVLKLLGKEPVAVNPMHRLYVYISMVFIIFTVVIICIGGDILLATFVLTLGSIFFALGGYASRSPYNTIGSERELLQMMAYEPMVLLTAIGLYYAENSFFVKDIISAKTPSIVFLPGIFIGLIYILTFKLRKSPFDLSMSHHAHQEIVRGITTEYSGRDLAIIEISHWYEVIVGLSLVYLFFAGASVWNHVTAVIACLIAYFLEILIDNGFARVKWQLALQSAWIVTGVTSTLNLVIISLFK